MKKYWINFFLGILLIIIGYFLYLFYPLLKKGEEFMAELSLGGSIVFFVFGIFFYMEFWNSLYKKNSLISKFFYLSAGAGFILLISHPWQITYVENYGYTQPISELFLLTIFMEGSFGIIIFSKCIYNIKTLITQRLEYIESILRDKSIMDNEKSILLRSKINLEEKNNRLDLIIILSSLGAFITMIGFFPKTFILDSIGVFMVFFPQIYYFSKDKEIILFLFSQRIQDDVKSLQKNIDSLYQNPFFSLENQTVEIASLIEFIKKTDKIINKKP